MFGLILFTRSTSTSGHIVSPLHWQVAKTLNRVQSILHGQVTPSANRINTFLQGYSHQAMSLYYKIRFRIPSDFINGKKKINKLRPINYYTTTSKEKWNRNFLWSFNLKFLIHQWHILILQGFNLCGQTRKNWITFDTNCRYLILHFQG